MVQEKINPSHIQARASNPHSSVWVAASAGTGKTKVLTDRILRLLLDGASLDKILCLTFTKNAAAEMVARLLKTTRAWVGMDDATLRSKLADLFQSSEGINQHIAKSRTLFATILEDVQTLKVKTIHAFCQQILKKFAIEAGINPSFTLMDDFQQKELLAQSYHHILRRAEQSGTSSDAELYAAFDIITHYMDEMSFEKLQASLIADAPQFYRLFHGRAFKDVWNDELTVISIDDTLTQESILDDFWQKMDRTMLSAIASDFLSDPKKAKPMEAGQILADFVRTSSTDFDLLKNTVLTKENKIRSSGFTKKERYDDFVVLGNLILSTIDRLRSLVVRDQTRAVLRIAYSLLTHYQSLKKTVGLMDFNDLILHTQTLFQRRDIAPWILYKLDGGIDHILVDEAQDTSPVQWQIIEALCDEFFSDGADHDHLKTLFVVGDQKQSIFSFQGADVSSFIQSHQFFKQKITEANHPFEDVPMATSFRTVSPILNFVDRVFAIDEHQAGVIEKDDPTTHIPFRTEDAGKIELWPLPKIDEKDKDDFYYKPSTDIIEISNPVKRLANLIAERIQTMIAQKEILHSENRPVQEKDFLILTRKRSELAHHLSRALKNRGLKFEGIDRFELLSHIAAQDLMAAAQFVLYPHDDLNFAGFFKSPLVGGTEDQLFKLAHDRGNQSIWDRLQAETKIAADAFAVCSKLFENRHLSAYSFYTLLLEKMGGREKLLERLGLNALDPIEEFITFASEYEQSHIGDLQHFVQFMKEANPEIKREQEQEKKEGIRLMTVHGSKGLEAPIVFLIDTCSVPTSRDFFHWTDDGHFLIATNKEYRNHAIDELVENHKAKAMDEYRRLLYVAMTRARDQLYITGHLNKKGKKPADGSWYNMIAKGFQAFEDSIVQERPASDLSDTLFNEDAVIYRIETDQKRPVDVHQDVLAMPPSSLAFPDQPFSDVSTDIEISSTEHRSIFDAPEVPRVLGTKIHQMLEYFPHLTPEKRLEMIQSTLASIEIPENKKDFYKQSLTTISTDNRFRFLFDNQVSEASIIHYQENERHLLTRPDKIVFKDGEVWVIDYKTDFNLPNKIPESYEKQLKNYKQTLRLIYKAPMNIRLFILWIAHSELMEIK